MVDSKPLNGISEEVIQTIYQCLYQAVGDDYLEADNYLELETRISKPFLIWDLINRNLIKYFAENDVLYATPKRGMWEVLLLYDNKSKMLLSFMKEQRFREIQKAEYCDQPKYIHSLLLLNQELNCDYKQTQLFEIDNQEHDKEHLSKLLDTLCASFTMPVQGEINHHALVVFASDFGQLNCLKAYVLDTSLNVVYEQNWLDIIKPLIVTDTEVGFIDAESKAAPKLTEKAIQIKAQKEIVTLKEEKHSKKKA